MELKTRKLFADLIPPLSIPRNLGFLEWRAQQESNLQPSDS